MQPSLPGSTAAGHGSVFARAPVLVEHAQQVAEHVAVGQLAIGGRAARSSSNAFTSGTPSLRNELACPRRGSFDLHREQTVRLVVLDGHACRRSRCGENRSEINLLRGANMKRAIDAGVGVSRKPVSCDSFSMISRHGADDADRVAEERRAPSASVVLDGDLALADHRLPVDLDGVVDLDQVAALVARARRRSPTRETRTRCRASWARAGSASSLLQTWTPLRLLISDMVRCQMLRFMPTSALVRASTSSLYVCSTGVLMSAFSGSV